MCNSSIGKFGRMVEGVEVTIWIMNFKYTKDDLILKLISGGLDIEVQTEPFQLANYPTT